MVRHTASFVRSRRRILLRTLLGLCLGLPLGCGQGDQGPAQQTASTAPTAAGSAPSASAATTAAPSPDHPWAGVWSGRFVAKKGSVSVPDGVAYPVWREEKGDEASGSGAVELTIAADGEVSGRGRGALGAFVLRGRVEGETLRSGLTPADPEADASMSGFLTAAAKDAGKALEATLRVAGGKGARVRTATFVLAQGALEEDASADPATRSPSAAATSSSAP